MKNLDVIRKAVMPKLNGCFELPKVEGKKNFYIVPLSGGIDSFVTAYVFLALFPDTPVNFVHCDTKFEVEGTEDALDAFEKITGRKILKLVPEKGLLDVVESQGNFIPSQTARYCTQTMKTLPSKRFYEALQAMHGDDVVFFQFVGLRADEPTREGIDWGESNIASSYPLQQLSLTKSDVNSIISQIQGIPLYYLDKSRSGCETCIFARRSEIIASWYRAPKVLERAAATEELPSNVLSIYQDLPRPVTDLVGAARNWLNYYRPAELGNPKAGCESVRGKNKISSNVVDLFGASEAKRLYVAVEFYYYANEYGLCDKPHVFFEKLISYSTTLAGINKALKSFWLHRLQTKELYSASEDSLDKERQVFVYEVEVDDFEQHIPPAPEGVFTWQNDRKPLYAIRKTVAVIERILLTEGERQNTKNDDLGIRSCAVDSMKILNNEKEYGRILSVIPFKKPALRELVDDRDVKSEPAACFACSK